MAQSICATVPAAASGGVLFGTVVARQTYNYQASGCIRRSVEANFADPDGDQYFNDCTTFITNVIAPGTYTCPGLSRFALVGKINGASCFQLGKIGTFTAPSSGPLVLYCNDDIYGDNSGSWNVCITPVAQACATVPANAAGGVSFGNVVAGQTYSYTASGCVARNLDGTHADPDGNQYTGGCTTFYQKEPGTGGFTCPGMTAFSLVGKVGGSCLQLGKSGVFVAPSSGLLVLYCNDDIYGDNSGSWSVCITPVQPPTELVISCPADVTTNTDAGQCVAAGVVLGSPSVTDNCSGGVTVTNDAPEQFPMGSNTVVWTATDGCGNSATCTQWVIAVDAEAPRTACRPAPNPSAKKIPVSGKNPSSGQNPDGYYQLLAKDNCDPNPVIYVQDTGSAYRAGPFVNGDIVKISQNPGGTPHSDPGTPPIVAHVHLNGDGLAVAVDADGNETPAADGCLMLIPPDPK